MNLVEVMVAAMLFTSSSLASLHLWQDSAAVSHSLENREDEIDRANLLRLRIQSHLRNHFTPDSLCPTTAELLEATETALEDESEIRIGFLLVDGVEVVQVKWEPSSKARFAHFHLFTPQGLGACV